MDTGESLIRRTRDATGDAWLSRQTSRNSGASTRARAAAVRVAGYVMSGSEGVHSVQQEVVEGRDLSKHGVGFEGRVLAASSPCKRVEKSAAQTHMTKPDITGIAPLFIVSDVPAAMAFYRD